MDILCFATTKDNHNISLFIEAFGRNKVLPETFVGSPCVNIDLDEGKIYCSIGLVTGSAKRADYWGEGTADQNPYQAKQHILCKRQLFCELEDPMLPVADNGDPIPVEDLLNDNSELMQLIWSELVSRINEH